MESVHSLIFLTVEETPEISPKHNKNVVVFAFQTMVLWPAVLWSAVTWSEVTVRGPCDLWVLIHTRQVCKRLCPVACGGSDCVSISGKRNPLLPTVTFTYQMVLAGFP